MPEATITGVNNTTITIPIGSAVNAALAQQLMALVNTNVLQGLVTPYEYSGQGPLNPPAGEGSLELTGAGPVNVYVPADTTSVFDASDPTIHGGQASTQLVVTGLQGVTYFANAGIGTVIAGGGNNFIGIGRRSGNHLVLTDAGNDTIKALSGNDSIGAGLGSNLVILGGGNDLVDVTGCDTVRAGSGQDTVTVEKGGEAVVYGDFGQLSFVDYGAASTVFGGGGSATLQAGSGSDVFVAGQGADSFVFLNGAAGGNTEIQDFTLGVDKVVLQGYGPDEVAQALQNATVSCGSVTLRLSDNTTITFDGITRLGTSSFG